MRNNCMFLAPVLILFSAAVVLGADASLASVEKDSLDHSPRLKSLSHEQKAAAERLSALKTQSYPKLYLEGSYRYITNVQEISLPIPNSKPVKFGDNSNYSIGPAASWLAWDSGGVSYSAKSLSSAAEAKNMEIEAARRQITLAARTAYFQVSLTAEQVALYADALKLSNTQYEDIKLNVRAGTKSRADELKAHQEVLSRMKQLSQARADLSAALESLSALTGKEYDPSTLENADTLLLKFEPLMNSSLNVNHPSLGSLKMASDASLYAAKSAAAGRWPKLLLSAKASLDYPYGNKPESYNQNAVSASLNWPLFEAGAVNNRVNENNSLKDAAAERGSQLLSDLRREWKNTMEQIANLEEQKKLNEISVAETDELKTIIYKAYITGAVSFLEVESANFKALEAKIYAARTKMQILINLAVIAGLAE